VARVARPRYSSPWCCLSSRVKSVGAPDVAAGSVTTRRWNDPARRGEGTRVLVTRYRPRGVRKEDETWDEWYPALGPSPALHAAAYGKDQPAIDFATYRHRYLEEMADDPGRFYLRALAGRVAAGEAIALLCSSACVDETRCHRSVLARLVLELAGRGA
jgi:uncharacterized protein YeaO (DUF488 family)